MLSETFEPVFVQAPANNPPCNRRKNAQLWYDFAAAKPDLLTRQNQRTPEKDVTVQIRGSKDHSAARI